MLWTKRQACSGMNRLPLELNRLYGLGANATDGPMAGSGTRVSGAASVARCWRWCYPLVENNFPWSGMVSNRTSTFLRLRLPSWEMTRCNCGSPLRRQFHRRPAPAFCRAFESGTCRASRRRTYACSPKRPNSPICRPSKSAHSVGRRSSHPTWRRCLPKRRGSTSLQVTKARRRSCARSSRFDKSPSTLHRTSLARPKTTLSANPLPRTEPRQVQRRVPNQGTPILSDS